MAAIGALLLGFGGFALAVVVAVQEFPRGLIALACIAVAVVAAWYGIVRVGAHRVVGLAVGALGLAAAIGLLFNDRLIEELVVVGALVLGCVCGRRSRFTPAAAGAGLPAAGAVLESQVGWR